ncbi:M23 family metallopeptidase [Georgenia daeguensis]|uniref:M23ase beta-sheet core domain-containing protein n=1 Tax=Georgenia daeguensis TaxID=908355 RepID=A0ABP6UNP6_9MICO
MKLPALVGGGAVLTLGGVVGFLLLLAPADEASACAPGSGITVANADYAGASVAGYSGEQLRNAAAIVNAGAALGLSVRDQTIGVMTAMGESGLQVLDHGDAIGPDSRGLFQQRDNGAWGTYADRMDPTGSATMFFQGLSRLEDRDTLPPTIAAHRVQRNADPYHYERYWDGAVAIVQALADTGTRGEPTTDPTTDGAVAVARPADMSCLSGAVSPAAVSMEGWTAPIVGFLEHSSEYGMRTNPVTAVHQLHSGTDLAARDGHPIYAVADGIVTIAGPSSGGNTGYMVAIDHGGGIQSRYVHSWASGVHVRVGDRVTVGQHIADVGSSGNSTGPHLHFEIRINGEPTDPVAFMAARGINITTP